MSRAPLLAALVAALLPFAAAAQQPDVADLDIEELGRIRVTSTSRRPEPASQATAAVFVLTREDIRRSGAMTLPGALRLVPGLQVARVTSRDWSITSRGFAETSPNKLLVLVDGRAVYSPLFAGVFWDVQDVVLEDVDRIEVILGSGATLWGSNAVNGVINVITRPAAETRSRLLAVRPGTGEHLVATGRYGTGVGAGGGLRVYARYLDREPSDFSDGSEAEDDWRHGQGGFRFDVDAGARDRLTFQGDLYAASGGQRTTRAVRAPPFNEVVQDELDVHGGNLLARWSRRLGEGSELQVHAYYDRAVRELPSTYDRVAVDIGDLEFQHHMQLGRRHDFLWGAGYRLNADEIDGDFPITLAPRRRTTHLVTGFVQDEIALAERRWYLTLGTKLERNEFSGLELQPNVRLLWLPGARHTLWSAVSRAVRIPSRIDTDLDFTSQIIPGSPPTLVRFDGNEDFESEELVTLEGGWRAQFGARVSADVSAYYGWYDRLRTTTPLAPVTEGEFRVQPFLLDNDLVGHAWGGTAVLNWQPGAGVRLQGAYTLLQMEVSPSEDAPPGSVPSIDPDFSPEHQAQLRTSLTFAPGIELDLALRYVGELAAAGGVPDYVEADTRLGWHARPGLSLALIGRDLLHSRHPEFPTTPQREFQRRGAIQLEWRF